MSPSRYQILKFRWGFRELTQLWPCLCAPILLVGVACLQLYQAHLYYLVPWKGGGFGMFATVDAPSTRFLRCYLLTATGAMPLRVPEHLGTLAGEIRYLPKLERMSIFATKLAQTARAADAEFQGVRVELWRYGFDAQNGQLEADKLLEVTVAKERVSG